MHSLSTTVAWGELLAAKGEHQCSRCEQCCFYARPCQLQIAARHVDETVLIVSPIGDVTAEFPEHLFGDRLLHRELAVTDVVLRLGQTSIQMIALCFALAHHYYFC